MPSLLFFLSDTTIEVVIVDASSLHLNKILYLYVQWFPEGARACVLQGAELLLYPTAIGSEPPNPNYNSYPHWVRTMQGHAASNMVPVIASNRIGTERFEQSEITFYGGSFIAGPTGEVVAQVGAEGREENGGAAVSPEKKQGFVVARFDLDELQVNRAGYVWTKVVVQQAVLLCILLQVKYDNN